MYFGNTLKEDVTWKQHNPKSGRCIINHVGCPRGASPRAVKLKPPPKLLKPYVSPGEYCNAMNALVYGATPRCGSYLFQLVFSTTIEKRWRAEEGAPAVPVYDFTPTPRHSNHPHGRSIDMSWGVRVGI